MDEFTEPPPASEPGCLWFDWSAASRTRPSTSLVEAFRDDEAGGAHVQSDHFQKARQTMPPHLVETPRIVNMKVPESDWSLLGEMEVPPQQ